MLATDVPAYLIAVSLGLAVAAALAAVVGATVVARLMRGGRSLEAAAAVEYLTRTLHESSAEIERLRALLELQEREVKRRARLGELRLLHDLDRVAEQALAVGLELSESDAAELVIRRPTGEPNVYMSGFAPDEAPAMPAALPTSSRARSIVLAYDYPSGTACAGEIATGVVIPLQHDSADLGSLALFRRAERGEYTAADLDALEDLRRETVAAVVGAQRYEQMKDAALRDGLTSLYNRAYFHQQLARESRRAKRYGRPLTVILFDLDNFKTINDALGHLEADAVLGEVAARINLSVRTADVAARVGGDEFAVIMPESRPMDARRLFERVQAAVSVAPTLTGIQVTLSAGVAALQQDDEAGSLFTRADRALFDGKRHGKGACTLAVAAEDEEQDAHDQRSSAGGW